MQLRVIPEKKKKKKKKKTSEGVKHFFHLTTTSYKNVLPYTIDLDILLGQLPIEFNLPDSYYCHFLFFFFFIFFPLWELD